MAFQPGVFVPVHVAVQGQAVVPIRAVHVVKVYPLEMALVFHALVQVHGAALAHVAVQGQAAVLIHAAHLVKVYQLEMASPVEVYIAARFYAAALVSLVEMAFVVQV